MELSGNLGNEKAVLEILQSLSTPLWVFDFDKSRVTWANDAALILWEAATVDELASRDMSDDTSLTVVQHLQNIRKRIRNGDRQQACLLMLGKVAHLLLCKPDICHVLLANLAHRCINSVVVEPE